MTLIRPPKVLLNHSSEDFLTDLMKRHTTLAKSIKSFDNTHIYYEIDVMPSTKKYLILLHGLGSSLTAWESERTAFRELGYATLAVDLRGHGLSDHPSSSDAYNIENFILDIHLILEKENMKHAVIIGHSFGAMIALTLEGRHPKTFHSLILMDASYKVPFLRKLFLHHALYKKLFELCAHHLPNTNFPGHLAYDKFVGTAEFNAERFSTEVLHTSLKGFLLVCEQLIYFDASKLLKNIVIPTLVIDGTKDSVFPPRFAKDLSHRLRKAHLDLIPDATHAIVINNSRDVVKDISRFLKKNHF